MSEESSFHANRDQQNPEGVTNVTLGEVYRQLKDLTDTVRDVDKLLRGSPKNEGLESRVHNVEKVQKECKEQFRQQKFLKPKWLAAIATLLMFISSIAGSAISIYIMSGGG